MLDRHRARGAWLSGARLVSSDPARAATHFAKAIALDEGMADAWLGLHLTGHEQETAVAAIIAHAPRFGEERRRNMFAMASVFSLGPYVTYRLETHPDLWCAQIAGHLHRRETGPAAAILANLDPAELPVTFLHGWCAFQTGDREAAITHLRAVISNGDPYLETVARLLSGILLSEVGAIEPSRDHLTWVLEQSVLPEVYAETHYWLGLIARVDGDEDTAGWHLHHAYALNPGLEGLDAALQCRPATARLELHRPDHPEADVVRAEPQNPATETVEDVLADLEKQIGQEGIKRQVRILLAQTRAQLARRDAGIQQNRMTEHFVFTGPPGTGKTTIARLIGRLYKALGILEGGHLVEVDRSTLIGEYHGHTVARTQGVLDRAIGGVLLIDEAYALQTEGFSGGDPFGQEAIDTLLKRMEDDRDSFVVIAAGYPEPMRRFIDSNPGLKSRFTTTIDFTPYRTHELLQIAELMANDTANQLTGEAHDALQLLLEELETQGTFEEASFGNARFIRNLIEKASRQRDLRIFSDATDAVPDVQALTEITGDDIRSAVG